LSEDLKRWLRILGLEPGASAEEIRQAFRDLAQVWHPDRFTHDQRLHRIAEERLKNITEAYNRLRTMRRDDGKRPRAAKVPARRRRSGAGSRGNAWVTAAGLIDLPRWLLVLGIVAGLALLFSSLFDLVLHPDRVFGSLFWAMAGGAMVWGCLSRLPGMQRGEDGPDPWFHVFLGLFLVFVGSVLMAESHDLVQIDVPLLVSKLWPAVIALVGFAWFLQGQRSLGVAVVVMGGVLELVVLKLVPLGVLLRWWPLLPIAVGVGILIRYIWETRATPST
jgi:hypothetical protein